jgi:hypothetical protein
MSRWKYVLVLVALVSWLAKLLLNYISDAADWFWYLSFGCWIILFLLVWPALFRRNWRELAVLSVALSVMLLPLRGVGDELVEDLQDKLFRAYVLQRIGEPPFQDFLSKCKLTHYVGDDGSKHTIGQCDDGLRLTWRLFLSVIYDPTGQFALPGYQRSTPWRLAVDDAFAAGYAIKRDEGRHLRGDFYYIKVYGD